MKLTPAESVSIALLVVLLAATSVAQSPPWTSAPFCYSPSSTAPPTTTCPDLADGDAARAAAAAAAAAADQKRIEDHNAEIQAEEAKQLPLKNGLDQKVKENSDKLHEAEKKADEIVGEVQKAADEAADSAREAAKTKEECFNTVMLEMRPVYMTGCAEPLDKLRAASSAGSQMETTLNFCAGGAGLLAFHMIQAGDACASNIDACNDVQKKAEEAKPDLAKIKDKDREGGSAYNDVLLNLIFANGLNAECASAADSAAKAAISAAADIAAALQDQANGDKFYQAAYDAYAAEVSTFAAKCAADIAYLNAAFALKQADAHVATAQSASDACYAELAAAAECNKMTIQTRCSALAGALTEALVQQTSAKQDEATAKAAKTKADADYKAALAAATAAWAAAQRVSAHTSDTKV